MTQRFALFLIHRFLCFAFSISAFWFIGQASRTRTKPGVCLFSDSPSMLGDAQASESNTMLTLKKRNKMHVSPIALPLFSNQPSLQLTQDQKGLYKACNGAECK
ncbi:hypothetical protein H5410_061336, partial [Solanum commersonii]